MFNYTDKGFFWEVSVARYNLYLAKLAILGLIEVTKEDKYNPTFAITEEGIVAIRQQNYSNLAQTALFNLQTLKLSKRAVWQNWMMIIVAVASIVVAIVSVCVALIR